MSEKFKNKYRIPSARLQTWDYGWNAAYFVTICTLNRECYFGNVVNGKMQLSEIGEIVKTEWLKTFELRPDMNLQMDEFVVMPNHFHAIIIIGENIYNTGRGMERAAERTMECGAERTMECGAERTDAMHCVSTANKTNESKNKFGPQSKNLASIIRGFKIGVTKNACKIHAGFAWQPRFHDHIIRNDESYQRISEYIKNNPANWSDDKFYN